MLAVVHQLQPCDHVIAALLVDHRTLTTGQLTAVLFDSPSTARGRLYRLRHLRWVDRFTPSEPASAARLTGSQGCSRPATTPSTLAAPHRHHGPGGTGLKRSLPAPT